MKFLRTASVLAACLMTLPAAAAQVAGGRSGEPGNCAALALLRLPHVTITQAQSVAAGTLKDSQSATGRPPVDGSTLPAFCRVAATARPTPDSDIRFEVWLPLAHWNGKYLGGGNGVWAGTIAYDNMVPGLLAGYVASATDMGHQGNPLDGSFIAGHPEKLVDFGHRAVHETTLAAKQIINAFYGKPASRSLYMSCSTGGRVGLMEAYRYPADFDAISAMAPGNSMVDLMVAHVWGNQLLHKDPGSMISPATFQMVRQAVVAACDADDGVKDGIVSAPQRCGFDPAAMQCTAAGAPSCLTAAQVAALRGIYAGPRNPRTGKQIFAGFPRGSEGMLPLMIGGPMFPYAETFMRSVVFQDPQWDSRSFDFDRDVLRARRAGSRQMDVPSDGVRTFLERGGKLLLSHGTADGLIPYGNTVNLYEALTKSVGKARDNARLFLLPGMAHCRGGEGLSEVDMLAVIDQWVETGNAPERIIARNPANAVPRTRPLCPYPQEAKYVGTGSTDEAANFLCAAPSDTPTLHTSSTQ